MGIFARRSRESGQEAEPDPDLPFLTVDEATEIRRLAQRAFADAGIDVQTHPDHLSAPDGQLFGLWNLAATCHAAPKGRREWPGVVRNHVQVLLTAPPSAESLSLEEVLPRVYLRVYGTDTLPAQFLQQMTYARPIADGLLEALALDSPESVVTLMDTEVTRLGVGELRRAGLENLLREPIDAIDTVRSPAGADIQVVLGDSVYTASRILAMRDLLQRVFGDREYPNGVLVAVPIRHQVALLPLDGGNPVAAISAVAGFAAAGFSDGVGGVTPSTYWWHDGVLTRITTLDERGKLAVHVDAELDAVLTRLAEQRHPNG